MLRSVITVADSFIHLENCEQVSSTKRLNELKKNQSIEIVSFDKVLQDALIDDRSTLSITPDTEAVIQALELSINDIKHQLYGRLNDSKTVLLVYAEKDLSVYDSETIDLLERLLRDARKRWSLYG
jgi:hypothetical protein